MAEPPVTIEAYHHGGMDNTPVGRIVIHTTSPPKMKYPVASAKGQARRTALYFTLPSSGGSAHYVCDVATEEHCLRDNMVAHHAPPNRGSLGIEICALPTYTREQWLSADVWPAAERARDRAVELSHRHGVPWVRLTVEQLKKGGRGVCGHVDVSQAFGQTDHTDPGPNFPWDVFMVAPAPPVVIVPFPGDHMRRLDMTERGLDPSGHGYTDLPTVPAFTVVSVRVNTADYAPVPQCVGDQDYGGHARLEWTGPANAPAFGFRVWVAE